MSYVDVRSLTLDDVRACLPLYVGTGLAVLVTPEVRAHILASEASTYALAKELSLSQFAVWSVRQKGAVQTTHLAQASVFTWRPELDRKAA